MKDLFDMTRHERRGMIAMLIVIALSLVVAIAARCHHEDVSHDVSALEINRFESVIDSVAAEPDKPQHTKPQRTKATPRRTKKQPSGKPKPAQEPRRIEPVPNF